MREQRQLDNEKESSRSASRTGRKTPEQVRAASARYRARHPDRRKASKAKWYERNKERWKAYRESRKARLGVDAYKAANRAYYASNKEDFPARVAQRRARKKQAMPSWADKKAIAAMYAEASRRTRETGVPHHVDHIVPLQHELVCGLHCEANLRVVEAFENFSKNNRYWPGMP